MTIMNRRYSHFVLIIVAYSFLILVARWAVFTQIWTRIGTEPTTDSDHLHAVNKSYAIKATNLQGDTRAHKQQEANEQPEFNVSKNQSADKHVRRLIKRDMKENSLDKNTHKHGDSKVHRKKRTSNVIRKHQLLRNIFTNFLHP